MTLAMATMTANFLLACVAGWCVYSFFFLKHRPLRSHPRFLKRTSSVRPILNT
ncbi:hypothetical protein PF003_g9213 [Phytophthora fragariae]|nr:hypothetical protein PF003_g9213 [Phytophthora fragariae]